MGKNTSQKRHINIKNIFNKFCHEDKIWIELIKKEYKPEAQFLYLLAPCITYIYTKISATKLKKYTFLEHDAKNTILQRFVNHWLPKIIMCCVLELNDAKELNLLSGETPEKRFDNFIDLLGDNNNRLAFFDKYVVLKEKIQRYVVQEIEALTEILMRLDKCFDQIRANFNWKNELYSLKSIQSSGDSHGSRNVCILVLTDNTSGITRIVYKPRALLMDKAYNEFLEWLNPNLKIPLYSPKLLLKEDYGWCEFINNVSCENEKQIKEYYQNLGNLLAVIYLLCGSDIHYENIIACGKHPVIIDVECLFVPDNLLKKNFMPFQEKAYSVLNTLLLPCRVLVKKGAKGIDISGFTNQANQEVPYQSIIVEESGTDNIRLVRKTTISTRQNNIPKLLNKVIDPIFYQKCVTEGFKEAYHIFLSKKELILNQLCGFKKARTRLVFRSTAEYIKLLIESYHPMLLCKKSCYKRHFSDWINRKKSIQFLHGSEIDQILLGDIPAYYAMVSSRMKLEDFFSKKVDAKFSTSGYAKVIRHIRDNISENDLNSQLHIIEQSFICYKRNINKLPSFCPNKTQKMISRKKIESNAEKLLIKISRNTWLRDDLMFWPYTYSEHEVWNIDITTPWMYDGLTGIALVFGVASYVFKNEYYRQFTIRAINAIERYTVEFKKQKNCFSIGAFSGLGGILYLTQFLNKYHYQETLIKIKNTCFSLLEAYILKMKPISIESLDIISGLSGLLKILVNFKSTPDEKKAFKLANYCVKHIINVYPNPSELPKQMMMSGDFKKPLLGFSHGVSGIAWALYHYFITVKKSKMVFTWIENALAYERKMFSDEHQNWPCLHDSNVQNLEKYPVKWCHGAVGIGFSRISLYIKGWRDEYILNEIKIAIQTTLTAPVPSYLNLCHGALGNLDFLKYAVETGFLDQERYNNYFLKLVPYINESKSMITENHSQLFIPGLMTGKAGVAYQLIKILYPTLPCLLLLDIDKT